LLIHSVFHDEIPPALCWQIIFVFIVAAIVPWLSGKWKLQNTVALAITFSLFGFFITAAEIPRFETGLRGNQTLKPLGIELTKNFRPGDAIVCWGKFPEGLPFYCDKVITPTNRPYLGGMDLTQVPFEFPGNRERLGDMHLLLPDDNALAQLLQSEKRIWLVGFGETVEKFRQDYAGAPLHLISQVGQWQLYSNR